MYGIDGRNLRRIEKGSMSKRISLYRSGSRCLQSEQKFKTNFITWETMNMEGGAKLRNGDVPRTMYSFAIYLNYKNDPQ